MRGLFTFEADGVEHALQFNNNRLCQLEEDAGESVMALFAKLDDPTQLQLRDVRMIFRAGLVGEFSLEAAGDLIDQIGIHETVRLVVAALSSAFKLTVVEGGKPEKPKTGAV